MSKGRLKKKTGWSALRKGEDIRQFIINEMGYPEMVLAGKQWLHKKGRLEVAVQLLLSS